MTQRARVAAAVLVGTGAFLGWLVAGPWGAPQVPSGGVRSGAAPGERVRIEVLNGAGRVGLARSATTLLRDAGYDVVRFDNAGSYDHDSTLVIDRVGRRDLAASVARTLGIGNVSSEPDPNLYVDVTVVLGADWDREELPSAPAPPARARAWWDPRGWLDA